MRQVISSAMANCILANILQGHFIVHDVGWAPWSFHHLWGGLNTYGHFIIYDMGWTPIVIASSMTWVEHHSHFIIHDMGWAWWSFHRPWHELSITVISSSMTWEKNSLFLSSQDSSWCQGKAMSILSTSHVCNGSHTKSRAVPGSSLSQLIYICRQIDTLLLI